MNSGIKENNERDPEKKPVQETLGQVSEAAAREKKEPVADGENPFQQKTGQIRRDIGR